MDKAGTTDAASQAVDAWICLFLDDGIVRSMKMLLPDAMKRLPAIYLHAVA
jgi:hypothetical protein